MLLSVDIDLCRMKTQNMGIMGVSFLHTVVYNYIMYIAIATAKVTMFESTASSG